MPLLGWLRRFLTPTPMAEFVVAMRKDPWLQGVYKLIIELSSPEKHSDPMRIFLTGEENREAFLVPILTKLLEVSTQTDRRLALRKWLHETVVAYAPHYVLCSSPGQDGFAAPHPGCNGLAEKVGEVIQAQTEGWLYDLWRQTGSVEETIQTLDTDFFLWHFRLLAVTIAQMKLDDDARYDGENLWSRYYVASHCAFIEDSFRSDIGLPRLCEIGDLLIERLNLDNNVLANYANPLDGIKRVEAI
jgi:hypothetical protein